MEDLYLSTLKLYCNIKDERKQNIEKAFEEENWKNYIILVHSLKSTSLAIGCSKLSNEAKSLELAGNTYLSEYVSDDEKQQGIAYIKEHHAEVMLLYDAVVNEGLQIVNKFDQ